MDALTSARDHPPTGGFSGLYTIGHSTNSLDELLSLLHQYQIGLVIDVRSVPCSRHTPQFNRESLAKALSTTGIRYKFAGDSLGGRPQDPTCYFGGRVPSGHVDYLSAVNYDEVAGRNWYQRGLQRLIQLAAHERVAVLCSEEDPYRCHRHHLIARSLHQFGLPVWHIRSSGSCEPAIFDPVRR